MEKEQDVAGCLPRAVIHLQRTTGPRSQKSGSKLRADFPSAVSAAAVDNDHFMRAERSYRPNRGSDVFFLV
jgi:hypothetical protein